MTKKLLFLFDTDPVPSVFDTVVGYDGGADDVIGYGGVTTETVGALVDGCIYTRGPKEKQNTAIFVGGGSMVSGEAVFKAVKKRFFSNFRVSVMLDSTAPTRRLPRASRCSPRRPISRAKRPSCLPAPARSACAPLPCCILRVRKSRSPREKRRVPMPPPKPFRSASASCPRQSRRRTMLLELRRQGRAGRPFRWRDRRDAAR